MSTSKLQKEVGKLLEERFLKYNFTIRENYRPDWLLSPRGTRLELDFYIDELKTAFEIQGDQHFRFVEFFHGDHDGFERRIQDDREKKNLCDGKGVRLVEICTLLDAELIISKISGVHRLHPKYVEYQETIERDLAALKREAEIKRKKRREKEKQKRLNIISQGRVWPPPKKKKVRRKSDVSQVREPALRSKTDQAFKLCLWGKNVIRLSREGNKDYKYSLLNGYVPRHAIRFLEYFLPLCTSEDDIKFIFDLQIRNIFTSS